MHLQHGALLKREPLEEKKQVSHVGQIWPGVQFRRKLYQLRVLSNFREKKTMLDGKFGKGLGLGLLTLGYVIVFFSIP